MLLLVLYIPSIQAIPL